MTDDMFYPLFRLDNDKKNMIILATFAILVVLAKLVILVILTTFVIMLILATFVILAILVKRGDGRCRLLRGTPISR